MRRKRINNAKSKWDVRVIWSLQGHMRKEHSKLLGYGDEEGEI